MQSVERSVAVYVSQSNEGRGSLQLQIGERRFDASEIKSALLWRGWQRFSHDSALHGLASKAKEWAFYKREWKSFCSGFGLALKASDVFCVNPPPFNTAYEEKCAQLLVAAQLGLEIPSTLYTADMRFARDFHGQQAGSIIYKPFTPFVTTSGGTAERPARVGTLYTSRVKEEDLNETEGRVPTPGIFQPYIDKQVELRIVIVGRRIFACAIHSQDSRRTRTDWRRYDLEHVRHEPYELPAEVGNKLLRLMDRLGLVFGSVDMIVTADGQFVFLEVNPNGQFDWIAQLAGLPIYENLASMLRAGSIDYPLVSSSIPRREVARAG
ncbi:hypothetical protein [Vitiosangium sp. GDMCC 1.1324]|uniref:hypothetical protein n=1 Tax=Vitiosangium sp. (strain GDMCC 1.1324) TaxID=2138576 RepID=UPI00130D6CC2|nr:hypothetical protein [Vitiosangium sp. GDMCC 1.1324]